MALTKIKTDGVTDDAITSGKIPANAVGSSEIADESVTLAKLEHGTSSNNGKFLRANNGADPTFETIAQPDLSNLSASNLTSGTVPDARFPATLPAISGANLTNLPASGKILQVKSASKENTFSVPGNANGATDVTGLSVTMDAPASSGSKYFVVASVAAVANHVGSSILLNGTTTGQLLTGSSGSTGTNGMSPELYMASSDRKMPQFTLAVLDAPNTTATQTYKVQVFVRYVFQSGFNIYVNRPNTNTFSGQAGPTGGVTFPVSTITVMEIAA